MRGGNRTVSGLTPALASATYVEKGDLLFDLRDFGGSPNGSDASDAWDAALAATGTTGGTIYLCPGSWRFSRTLDTLGKQIRIVGAGVYSTYVRPHGGFTGPLIALTSYSSGLADLAVHGGDTASTGVHVTQSRVFLDRLYIEHCVDGLVFEGTSGQYAHANRTNAVMVQSCTGKGIWVKGAWAFDNEFSNVSVGSNGIGVQIESSDTFWSNLHVWGSTSHGIVLRAGNTKIANPYLETNGGDGLNAYNLKALTIVGGRVWRNLNGLSLDTVQYASVVGVNIAENASVGIYGHDAQYNAVHGCTFYDAQATKTQDRPVLTDGTSDYWNVTGNIARAADHQTGAISLVGSNNIVGANSDTASASFAFFSAVVAQLGSNTSTATALGLNGAAASNRDLSWKTANVERWSLRADNSAESGSDADSLLTAIARTDAGGFKYTAWEANRRNGLVRFPQGISLGVKAGTVSDADFGSTPPDGTALVDSTNSKLWVKLGGAWKSVTLA